MLKFTVAIVAEFEGSGDCALIASGQATRAGLQVTWTGADDRSFRFVARPDAVLTWEEAQRLVEALGTQSGPVTG